MFHEVDTALRMWLRMGLPEGSAVTFGIPDDSLRAQGGKAPTVNSYLYKIRQVANGAGLNWVGVRARDGRVVGRQPPVRHYQLFYLLTAWASSAEEEHKLLGATLATLALQDTIPLPHLTGSLLEADEPVLVTVANAELPTAPVEIWSALGIPPRGSLDLVVTAPLVPPLMIDLAPQPRQVELEAESRRPPDEAGASRMASPADHRTRRLR